MQSVTVTIFPWFQPRKERTVVWLVSVGNDSVAADCLIRFDPLGLSQYLLDPFEHLTGARQRCAGRQLNVDTQDPLVFVGNETQRNRASENACAQHDDGYDKNRHDSATDQEP